MTHHMRTCSYVRMADVKDPIALEPPVAENLASFFTALSDPTRVRIIGLLAAPGRALSVQALAGALGMTHSAISHQLRLLRELRVVRARRAGRFQLYSLNDDHVARLYHEGLEHVQHG